MSALKTYRAGGRVGAEQHPEPRRGENAARQIKSPSAPPPHYGLGSRVKIG